MNADALRTLLHQKSFEPFQLILSSGDRYPVRHPEMVLLLNNRALIATDTKGSKRLPEGYVTVSYLHIAGAEPLNTRGSRRKAS